MEEGKIILTKSIKYDKDYNEKKNPAIVRLNEIMDVLQVLEDAETFLQKISKMKVKSKFLRKCCQIFDIENIDEIKEIEEI